MKVVIAAFCLLATLPACSEENSVADFSTTSSGADPATPPDPALVSRADTSETLSAVADGLDPLTTLISTNFYCYDQQQSSVAQPNATLAVSGSTATLSTDTESFSATVRPGTNEGQVVIADGSSEVFALELEFNEYGQVLTPASSDFTLEGCHQEGAAHEAALHRFMLNTPDIGLFSCNIIDAGSEVAIELLDNNRYRAEGQTGVYEYKGVTTDNSSTLIFLTGSLQDIEAEYLEDPETGIQTLLFSESNSQVFLNGSATSSNSLAAECKRNTQPRPFKRYGPDNAPMAIAPQRSLSGTYFVDTSTLTAETRSDGANYIEFRSSGYLHLGVPLPGGTNCTLTQPNGLPLCEQYLFDGQDFSIVTPWGQTLPASVSIASDGTLQTLGDSRVELMTAVDPASILGTWESQEVDSSGVASCAVGVCSYSITDRKFHFRADGQFLFVFGSESSSTFDTGMLTTFSNGTSEDKGMGFYSVNGNRLQLTVENQQAVELPVHLTQGGRLVIGEFQYNR